jgi:PhzF family phenazine biosynthesis protein
MNELTIYQVDAFTHRLFGGNPAAVIPLTQWLSDEILQNLAMENNLSETVFIIPTPKSDFHIRWFTPSVEVRLCGHATLATAHVLWHHLNFPKSTITFDSLSGILSVEKNEHGYTLDFPEDRLQDGEQYREIIINVLKISPLHIYKGKDDYMAILNSQDEIEALQPDFVPLKNLKARGLIATAKGRNVDFVSRCFFPEAGIEEDPVTGSAHTTMMPYWTQVLGKNTLVAQQLSARKGDLVCELRGDRVLISGQAKTYMIGKIFVD